MKVDVYKILKELISSSDIGGDIDIDVADDKDFDLLSKLKKSVGITLTYKQKKIINKLETILEVIPSSDGESDMFVSELMERIKLIGGEINKTEMSRCNDIWKKYYRF